VWAAAAAGVVGVEVQAPSFPKWTVTGVALSAADGLLDAIERGARAK